MGEDSARFGQKPAFIPPSPSAISGHHKIDETSKKDPNSKDASMPQLEDPFLSFFYN